MVEVVTIYEPASHNQTNQRVWLSKVIELTLCFFFFFKSVIELTWAQLNGLVDTTS